MAAKKMDLSFLLGAAPPRPRPLVPVPSPYEDSGWTMMTTPSQSPRLSLPAFPPHTSESPYAPPPQPRSLLPSCSRRTSRSADCDEGKTEDRIEITIDGVVVPVDGKAMQDLYTDGKMLVTPRARHTCKCGARFNRGLHYLFHVNQGGPECDQVDGPLYVCEHPGCESAFKRKTDRAKHVSCVHSKLRPYKCMECGCGFFFQKDVRKHFETVHRKLRPFQCKRCANCFGKKEHLKNHINRTHLHIKPYGCNICEVSLASKHNLQSHLQSRGHKATAGAFLNSEASRSTSLAPVESLTASPSSPTPNESVSSGLGSIGTVAAPRSAFVSTSTSASVVTLTVTPTTSSSTTRPSVSSSAAALEYRRHSGRSSPVSRGW